MHGLYYKVRLLRVDWDDFLHFYVYAKQPKLKDFGCHIDTFTYMIHKSYVKGYKKID